MKILTEERPSYGLLVVVQRLLDVERRSHRYGTDTPLLRAEIHAVASIHAFPGQSVTAMADRMGVTKGAVSQILAKLEAKGMVLKERDGANRSRFSLRLTEKGRRAADFHERLHRELDDLIGRLMARGSREQGAFVDSFLGDLARELDLYGRELP